MDECYDTIKCLCNSSLRLQILDVLDNTHMDLRDLKTELDSSRSTLQRNLTLLEQRGWIEDTSSGYTTTVTGCLLLTTFATINKQIERIEILTPFLAALDTPPPAVMINRFEDPQVTVPNPGQPDAPETYLLKILNAAEYIRGVLPVVSSRLVERYHSNMMDTISYLEIVLSASALDGLHERYGDVENEWIEEPKVPHREIRVYEGTLPYGLLLFKEGIVLTAYDEVGRMMAVVDTKSEAAIEWGMQTYETYMCESRPLCEE